MIINNNDNIIYIEIVTIIVLIISLIGYYSQYSKSRHKKTFYMFDDKFLLYACQQKYFNFDIYERPADFRTLSNNNNITTLEEMISHFYNSYKQQKIRKY